MTVRTSAAKPPSCARFHCIFEDRMDYARMLRSRAKGLEFERPHFSTHLFEPNRNLIKATLDKVYRKYFAA